MSRQKPDFWDQAVSAIAGGPGKRLPVKPTLCLGEGGPGVLFKGSVDCCPFLLELLRLLIITGIVSLSSFSVSSSFVLRPVL